MLMVMSPGRTVYRNRTSPFSVATVYVAFLGGSVFSASTGIPVTSTASVNSTVIVMFLPVPYVPPASSSAATRQTLSGVSTSMSDELESEPLSPGSGSSRSTKWFPAPIIAPRVCSAPAPS